MADGLLHKVGGRAAVKGVTDMGVPEPVQAYVSRQAGAGGGGLENAMRLRAAERTAFAAAEHRRVSSGRPGGGA